LQVLKLLGGQIMPELVQRTMYLDANIIKPQHDLVAMFEAALTDEAASLVAFWHKKPKLTVLHEFDLAKDRIVKTHRSGIAPGFREGLDLQKQVWARAAVSCSILQRPLISCAHIVRP
jgi:hypothetical protein